MNLSTKSLPGAITDFYFLPLHITHTHIHTHTVSSSFTGVACGFLQPSIAVCMQRTQGKEDMDSVHPLRTVGSPMNLTFLICKMGYHTYLRVNQIKVKVFNCFIKYKAYCSKNEGMNDCDNGWCLGRVAVGSAQATWISLSAPLQGSALLPPQAQFQLSSQWSPTPPP